MEIILVLDNIRSTYNVGAILRTAEGLGVKKVILSGYTPRWNDKNLLPHLREKLNREIHKTALGAEEMLEISSVDDVDAELDELKAKAWKIVGLENNIEDERLIKINDSKLKEKVGAKIVLVLGEEVAGIRPNLYPKIDCFVEIPMRGQKESFNVSVATGIILAFLTLS